MARLVRMAAALLLVLGITHARRRKRVIYVTGNQTTLVQLSFSVYFAQAEDSLPQVLAHLKAGAPLPVEAYNRDLSQRLAGGTLLSVDNQIDPATGTVRLRAVFPNEGNELFPNQFVNARLLVDTRRGVIVIPAAAIQRGPQDTFVYVVRPDRAATVRSVTVGEIQEGSASIKTGLSPGELVVLDGADRLREGSRVELRTQSSGPPPKAH